jgi:hypothetical protein
MIMNDQVGLRVLWVDPDEVTRHLCLPPLGIMLFYRLDDTLRQGVNRQLMDLDNLRAQLEPRRFSWERRV